jgi:DNA-binding NarL/FixJ family response regulator
MIRVLIVDDHAIMRRGLKEVLADEFSDLDRNAPLRTR